MGLLPVYIQICFLSFFLPCKQNDLLCYLNFLLCSWTIQCKGLLYIRPQHMPACTDNQCDPCRHGKQRTRSSLSRLGRHAQILSRSTTFVKLIYIFYVMHFLVTQNILCLLCLYFYTLFNNDFLMYILV